MRWQIANEALSAELAIIISYPTSASGIIVLFKTPTKYREFFPKKLIFSLFSILSRRVPLPHWRAWCNGSYIMMAEPIRALEFHYPMIPFLIIFLLLILLLFFIFRCPDERLFQACGGRTAHK